MLEFKLQSIILTIVLSLFISFLPADCKEIKIGLVISDKPIVIGANQDATLTNLSNNKEIIQTKKMEAYEVHNANGFISIIHKKTKTALGAFKGPIAIIPIKENSLVCCDKKWYRGKLTILTSASKRTLTVVNNVDFEDYLLSVVPSEIPFKWNKEALKAQAVAARSYALGYLGRRIEKGYDLESSVEDQVYLGVSSEKPSTSRAVKETKGITLNTKENKPLIALYHSSGGGYTDSIENLWDKPSSSHIQPRPDYDDNSPHFKWFRDYSLSEMSKLLASLNIGNITGIVSKSKSISNRVMWVEVVGTNGKKTIRGDDFRRSIKLPSAKFNFIVEGSQIKFAGRGYGHGLGLSQWGSKALAENGFTYKQILVHYYPGAKLITVENN